MKISESITSEQIDYSTSMLLVLAAPSVHDQYYAEYFEEIVAFQTGYAQQVISRGSDQIRIIVDRETRPWYADDLPAEALIEATMYDIWMRDFTTVNPEAPVQFVYTDASMDAADSVLTQKFFSTFADEYGLERQHTDYILDGGNIVDNYHGRVVTTTRFLEDNDLTMAAGKAVLRDLLGASQVAIIDPDDEVLAHADGMVAWLDENTLAVNDYSKIDPEFHALVLRELESSFPDVTIVPVPVKFTDDSVDQTRGIGSACGIHLNLVATHQTLYVPTFGTSADQSILALLRANTNKTVVPIDARGVCRFGGSVRCTTWQVGGKNIARMTATEER